MQTHRSGTSVRSVRSRVQTCDQETEQWDPVETEHNTSSRLGERLREGGQTEGEFNLKTHCWPHAWSSADSFR